MGKKIAKKKGTVAKKAAPAKKSAAKPAAKQVAVGKKVAVKKGPEKKTAEKKAGAKPVAGKPAPGKPAPGKPALGKKGAVAVKKPPAPKRPRAVKTVRLKAFWGVFNQSLRRIAIFEFNERKQADKRADELSKSAKSPHFVMPVKEVIEG